MNKESPPDRTEAVRNLLVFQLKLWVDAIRDILLSPLSIIFTLFDLIGGHTGKDSYFEKLLKFGRRSERRINLFNQYSSRFRKVHTVDSVVSQVEDIIRKEYRDGGLSSKAKDKIDKTMSKLRNVPPTNTSNDK